MGWKPLSLRLILATTGPPPGILDAGHNINSLRMNYGLLLRICPWTRLQGQMDSLGGFISPAGALLRVIRVMC